MAKSSSKSAAAPAARAAAPVAIGSSTVTASAQQPNASDGKGPDLPREALVLDWDPEGLGNDASFEGEHGVGNDPTTDTQTSARGKGKKDKESRQVGGATVEDPDGDIDWEQARHDRRFPSSDETEADGDDAGTGETKQATPEEKKSRADKREAVLKALQRQKSNLGAENAARESRAAAEAAAQRATAAEARIVKASTGTLAERLAFIGLSKSELTDALVMDKGELAAAAKDNGASNAEVAQLKADLAALHTKLDNAEQARVTAEKARVQEAAKKAIAESNATVAEIIKDEDVPLVHSEGAYARVLDGAWQAWKASGKKGAVADYVAAAAEVIEEKIEEEKPRLAALKKAAKGAPKDEAASGAARTERKPRPAVGRTTGPSRSANRRDSLAGVTDGTERDRIIAREMGWVTG